MILHSMIINDKFLPFCPCIIFISYLSFFLTSYLHFKKPFQKSNFNSFFFYFWSINISYNHISSCIFLFLSYLFYFYLFRILFFNLCFIPKIKRGTKNFQSSPPHHKPRTFYSSTHHHTFCLETKDQKIVHKIS
jgi:hypothetical protein